jgi:hypothetical protein
MGPWRRSGAATGGMSRHGPDGYKAELAGQIKAVHERGWELAGKPDCGGGARAAMLPRPRSCAAMVVSTGHGPVPRWADHAGVARPVSAEHFIGAGGAQSDRARRSRMRRAAAMNSGARGVMV